MILKYRNELYKLDGWRKIGKEESIIVIMFNEVRKEDEAYPYELYLDCIDEDEVWAVMYKHKEWDHKDERQLKYRICNLVYNKFINEFMSVIKDESSYIDLDSIINFELITKEAEEELIKEYEEYDLND